MEKKKPIEISNIKKITIIISVMALIAILTSFSKILGFMADYLWFKEVGYTSTFLKQVFAKLYIGVPFFIAFTGFIYFYFYRIKTNYYKHMNILTTKQDEKPVNRIIGIIAAILGVFFSFSISSSFWMQILRFLNSTRFGETDPIFLKDISFYVFTLPIVREVFNFMLGFVVFLMIITFVLYIVLISIRQPADTGDDLGGKIRTLRTKNSFEVIQKRAMDLALGQIMVIGVIFFLIVSLRSYIAAFGLLYSPTGATYGAGYTDINVTLWIYRIQIFVSLFSAGLLVYSRYSGNIKVSALGPIALAGVYIIGFGVQTFVQNIIVSPNELAREREYIAHTIEYTKKAYGLDDINVVPFEATQDLTFEDIENNMETITNISLNDYRPTREAFNQLQGLRGYYNFNDVDIDRYTLNGSLTQVFLSVRELDKEALDESAKTWVNKHLKFTHGYGVTVAPVNQLTASGQPLMVVRNAPPISDFEELRVTRPQIYFGELTNDYVIVNTDEQEFDYPMGDTLQTTSYEGSAGIRLSFFNKLLYSIREQSLNMLVSGSLNDESRIILNRNIMERTRKIAPFLLYDEDPYAVISEGRIFYIIDGYTSTGFYPYSEPYANTNINYIRNSFKVIVDAYNGDVDYYIIDSEDPLVQTYDKIFPNLFKTVEEMPEQFRAHLRYPQNIFDIQAQMYGTYHIDQPELYYNREDRWQVARQNYGGEIQEMESLYFTFKLPSEEEPEFVLSIPYTPLDRQNMIAFLIARNDGEDYGKLRLYEFPKNKTIIGPEQIEARISNNDVISRDLALWDSRGSQVIRGHLLTIPIEDSILYIEPLYIRAGSENAIPEVRRIIGVYGDRVVMDDNLEKVIERLFDRSLPVTGDLEVDDIPVDDPSAEVPILDSDYQELIMRANTLYEEAQEALRSGELGEYQRKVNEIGEILRRIQN
ncbi:uncharacterized membrane protein (UPF0182 family) [Acetoanaerobium pronyense]|uniref:UPF0182 protein J2Z35_001257 n=1 Tax=Acetoanaerobium pronyense TaxID=1482736 RepID=A0ABS4KI50_9FIRM|nr:UPF0182 family protein [Acetoanaerobium pronyense]MBP2027463.1 uncharacterized membrane protein (UPF0182 family) [Acetoanaerobium pronyense]